MSVNILEQRLLLFRNEQIDWNEHASYSENSKGVGINMGVVQHQHLKPIPTLIESQKRRNPQEISLCSKKYCVQGGLSSLLPNILFMAVDKQYIIDINLGVYINYFLFCLTCIP